MAGDIILKKNTSPETPSTADKVNLYVDDSDGKLKIKDSTGTTKEIAESTDIPTMASDAEAVAGTDEIKYLNSKQILTQINEKSSPEFISSISVGGTGQTVPFPSNANVCVANVINYTDAGVRAQNGDLLIFRVGKTTGKIAEAESNGQTNKYSEITISGANVIWAASVADSSATLYFYKHL